MVDQITVGGKYTVKGILRILLFTAIEDVGFTIWAILLFPAEYAAAGLGVQTLAFILLFLTLLLEHSLAGQIEHIIK